MSSFSRSMTLNLADRLGSSAKAVSMKLRAAGPRSFQNHQWRSALFSKSHIAIRIFAWALAGEGRSNAERATTRARATATTFRSTADGFGAHPLMLIASFRSCVESCLMFPSLLAFDPALVRPRSAQDFGRVILST